MYSITGYVSNVGYSDRHMQFKPKHLAYSPYPVLYNPDDSMNDFELTLSHKDQGGVSVQPTITADEQTLLYSIVEWIFNESLGGQLTASQADSQSQIAIAFNTDDRTVTIGPLSADSNNRIFPEWVAVTLGTDDVVTAQFRLYFSHQALEREYTFTVNQVVNMVADKDIYCSVNQVGLTEALAPYLTDRMGKISEKTEETPSTGINTLETLWVNHNNTDESQRITFDLLYFGPHARTELAAEAALRDYLLKDTTHDITVWEKTFPELFDVNEFTVVPMWDREVPGTTPNRYSPIFDAGKTSDLFKTLMTDITDQHLADNLQYLPTIYQSVACSVLAEIGNSNKKLTDLFPDYILANNQSKDFSLMVAATRAFAQGLIHGLGQAESYTDGDDVMSGFRVEVDGSGTYISYTSTEVKVRILTKKSYLALLGS